MGSDSDNAQPLGKLQREGKIADNDRHGAL